MHAKSSELPEPIQASSSGGWAAAPVTRGTMYGPAIAGTLRVDERSAAVLAALHPPTLPRPLPLPAPPATHPAPRPLSILAVVGLALAIPASPVGLVVSAIALGGLLSGRVRARGEHLALAGVVVSVLMLTAWIALLT